MDIRKVRLLNEHCEECGGDTGDWEPVEDENGPIIDEPAEEE